MNNEDIRLKIGERIKDLRKEKNMSIRELAELAGINKSTIVNLEAGRFDARLDTLHQIASVFGKEINFV